MPPRLPRAPTFLLWSAGATTAHVGLPVLLASRGRRHGWTQRRPGRLNLTGLLPLSAGAVGLAWGLIKHAEVPNDGTVALSLIPEFLLKSGPYRFSRNPLYIAELAMWLGWSILFGSPLTLAGTTALFGAMNVAVTREEKTLSKTFGAEWEKYAREVPRWL